MILKSPAHPSGEDPSRRNVLVSVFICVHPWLNCFSRFMGRASRREELPSRRNILKLVSMLRTDPVLTLSDSFFTADRSWNLLPKLKPLLLPPRGLRRNRRLLLGVPGDGWQRGSNGAGRHWQGFAKMLNPVKSGVRDARRDVALAARRDSVTQARDADAPADSAFGERPTKRPATERFSDHPARATKSQRCGAEVSYRVLFEPLMNADSCWWFQIADQQFLARC